MSKTSWKKVDSFRGTEKDGRIDGVDLGIWLSDRAKNHGFRGKKVLLILKVKE